MAEFTAALPYVLRHEGGWSNDPDDPGGATNYGITLAVAKRHGIATKESLRLIMPEEVAAIYRMDYWLFNGLTSQTVATKIFDMTVNFGPVAAIKMAQSVANDTGNTFIHEDGLWGPQTENAINVIAPSRMLEGLSRACSQRYFEIVRKRPESQKYLKGWLKRAMAVPCGDPL